MEEIQNNCEDIYYSKIRKKIKNIYKIKNGAVRVTAPKIV